MSVHSTGLSPSTNHSRTEVREYTELVLDSPTWHPRFDPVLQHFGRVKTFGRARAIERTFRKFALWSQKICRRVYFHFVREKPFSSFDNFWRFQGVGLLQDCELAIEKDRRLNSPVCEMAMT